MTESVETLMRILRKDEYEAAEKSEQALNESTTELYESIKMDRFSKSIPSRKIDYDLAMTKEVICECMENLYLDSLVIDDVEKYSDALRSGMREQCMNIMSEATTVSDLRKMFENASPYVKGMLTLAESIIDTKTDDDVKKYPDSVILSNEDKKLINDFERSEGKDVYAEELQNRIIDVYKKEQELGEERKERVQNVVDELAKIEAKKNKDKEDSEVVTESIESGFSMFSSVPETLFKSIFINKSKMVMNESAEGADLSANADEILAETISTYTLLECIHSLGFKTFTKEEKNDLKYQFFVG